MKPITLILILVVPIVTLWAIGCGEEEPVVKEPDIIYGKLTCVITNASTGAGVADVTITVDEGKYVGTTDSSGVYVFEKVTIGKHTVKISAPGYLDSYQTITVREEGITGNWNLTPGVRVTITVISDVGNPISGVRVSLGGRSGRTNDAGECKISPVLPGTYRLNVEKPGYKLTSRDGEVVGQDDTKFSVTLIREISGRIVFEKGIHKKDSFGISVINADGSGVVKDLTDLTDGYPCWSPDASNIVFQGKGADRRTGAWQIFMMNQNGSGIKPISIKAENDTMPAWAPDGRKIAFVHSEILGTPGIYVMNTDGSGRIKVAECYKNGWPTWDPDGNRIAFVKLSAGEDVEEANLDIFVVNSNGTNEMKLTMDADDEIAPAWSPDGSKITYTFVRNTGIADVYVTDLYSGGSIKVSHGDGYNGPSCWSPDGTRIAFSSDRTGDFGIYIVDPDGSNETRVYNNIGEDELINQGCWSK